MRISAAKWPLVLVGVLGISSCFISGAMAGLATTNLALLDPGFGPDANRWRGSASYNVGPLGFPFPPDEVEATVEWAAFAPGKFQDYLDIEHPGAIAPVAPGEVTYAYEVVNVAAASPGISTLTLGLDATDGLGSVGPTFVANTDAGDQAPATSSYQSTSIMWTFGPGANLLTTGENSMILVFTAAFYPELDFMQLNSGLATPPLPPEAASISDRIFRFEIPEPASLMLLMLGGMVMLGARRIRS